MSFSGILLCDGRAEVGGRLTGFIEVDGCVPSACPLPGNAGPVALSPEGVDEDGPASLGSDSKSRA